MCYVIVTLRTLLWTLLTVSATLAMVAALISPHWLVGRTHFTTTTNMNGKLPETSQMPYYPSVGIYNRCTKLHEYNEKYTDNCAPYVTSFAMPTEDFSNYWKTCLIFFAFGLALMAFTVVTSIIGCCIRSILKKSIFTVSGTIQSVAGLLFIIALVLYPAGWGSDRVKRLCGELAEPYTIDNCTLGWAFYLAMGGTFLTFICSVFSIWADKSTSTDKVQDKIMEDQHLILLV